MLVRIKKPWRVSFIMNKSVAGGGRGGACLTITGVNMNQQNKDD